MVKLILGLDAVNLDNNIVAAEPVVCTASQTKRRVVPRVQSDCAGKQCGCNLSVDFGILQTAVHIVQESEPRTEVHPYLFQLLFFLLLTRRLAFISRLVASVVVTRRRLLQANRCAVIFHLELR